MAIGGLPHQVYASELAVDTPGTAAGSAAAFAIAATYVSLYCDKDSWIGKSAAECGEAGDGSADGRLFCAAGERRVVPWNSRAFFCVNATGGESPVVRVEGWA